MIGSYDNFPCSFEQGKLSINASDGIAEFSSKFIVDEKLVKNYIEHLLQLQSVNEIRKQEGRKESKFEP